MTHSTTGRVKVAGLQPAQVLAGLLGLAFLVAGVAGFVRTGFGDFAGEHHALLLGFAVNPLHNVIHLAFGVLGLLMATGSGLARLYGWIVFLAYGAVLVWGLMLAGVVSSNPVSGLGNPLALNTNDNWLHLGLAAVGLLIAVLPARRKVVVPEQEVEPVAEPVRDDGVRDHGMPVQRDREDLNGRHEREPDVRDRRVESAEPTITTRPVQPIDPAVAEQHKARHYR
ncbi:DUF4383 domain-containing protein [Saccharothrix algeriensis]|uniref:DUF4383 domain-containing protein n=1 Tax=Saccharothrix algeriensis TaxID=173560 RepID=A0A8T8HUW6_9PSEU|nr:DUF4383 domain-containing protein [Saccharothrix algeriensis]MBM7813886.1 hypothetical protein [Saccharothrix algeriensis]QTR02318.1 DUF4383 domain-containing protein [Saccharothrix algeriensis]